MTLGERLKELRTERGLYLKDISELLNVGVSTISAYERNDKRPKPESIVKIAKFYGVTTDDLLGSENSVSDLESEIPEGVKVLRRMKSMTPEARAKMIQIMNMLIEQEEGNNK